MRCGVLQHPVWVLCLYIFLLGFKPSEPHLTRILIEEKHLTDDEVNADVYPVWTYAYFPLLLVAGPAAEVFGVRAVILLGTAMRVATRLLLLFGSSLLAMEWVEITYAFGSVSEVLLFSYVYALLPRERFAAATAATQVAYLLAHVAAGVGGDVMTTGLGLPLFSTLYVSAASVGFAFLVALFLLPATPSQQQGPVSLVSLVADRVGNDGADTDNNDNGAGAVPARSTPAPSSGASFALSATDAPGAGLLERWWGSARRLVGAYRRPRMLLFTGLWVVGNALWQFVYGWETSLYHVLQPDASRDWNGSVLGAALVATSAATSLLSLRAVERFVITHALACFVGLSFLCTGMLWGIVESEWNVAFPLLLLYYAAWGLWNASFFLVSGVETREAVRDALRRERARNRDPSPDLCHDDSAPSSALQTSSATPREPVRKTTTTRWHVDDRRRSSSAAGAGAPLLMFAGVETEVGSADRARWLGPHAGAGTGGGAVSMATEHETDDECVGLAAGATLASHETIELTQPRSTSRIGDVETPSLETGDDHRRANDADDADDADDAEFEALDATVDAPYSLVFLVNNGTSLLLATILQAVLLTGLRQDVIPMFRSLAYFLTGCVALFALIGLCSRSCASPSSQQLRR